jgi:hypothetical protein
MKRVVDALYGLKGYPNAAYFTAFKTDLMANGSTPAITMNTAVTNGISVTGVTTNAFRVTSASAVGLSLSGAFTSAAISVTATASRGLSIGTKGKSSDGSLAITATLPFDTEPANNYLLGVFSKVASTAVSATDDLGSAWIRTRLNAAMATNAGYSLYGAKTQLRIYGGTTTTVSNWAAAGVLSVLEVSGASTTFASGTVAAAGYFNVSLTSDATIALGAVVAGVAINSAGTGVTDTGVAYYGAYIKKAGSTAFDAGIKIESGSCKTGVDITIAALPVGDAYSGIRSAVTAAAPNNSYGTAGYFDTLITGTVAGTFVYGLGSWLNAGTITAASRYLCAQDNGVFIETGSTLTSSKIIFGLRMECLIGAANAGITHSELVFPFSVNTQNNGITALFEVMTASDLGVVGAGGRAATTTYMPVFRDAGGNMRYVLLYS